jgi:hypothetical protein
MFIQDFVKKLNKNITPDERISILTAVKSPMKKLLKFKRKYAKIEDKILGSVVPCFVSFY